MPAISVRGRHDSHYYSIAPSRQMSTGFFGKEHGRTKEHDEAGVIHSLSTKLSTDRIYALQFCTVPVPVPLHLRNSSTIPHP